MSTHLMCVRLRLLVCVRVCVGSYAVGASLAPLRGASRGAFLRDRGFYASPRAAAFD